MFFSVNVWLIMQSNFYQPRQAIAFMILGMLILPGMDGIAKWLVHSISAGQMVWCRFAVQTLIIAPFVLGSLAPLKLRDVLIHTTRGTLMVIGTIVFVTALKYLPIADAIAIFFVEPLILTLLAPVFLSEKVGWRPFTAVIVGMIGAFIVIRPNFQEVGWPAVLPLIAAITFAFYLILTRRQAAQQSPVSMQFYSGIAGVVVATILLLLNSVFEFSVIAVITPTGVQWILLLALGVISTVGHLLVVYAFQRGPAGLLAPFQYVEIIGATIIGLVVFSDFPDTLTWVGVAIIVVSGLYVLQRAKPFSAHL